jgi:hypothetical protein
MSLSQDIRNTANRVRQHMCCANNKANIHIRTATLRVNESH